MVQEINRFANNVFGAPKYREVKRRLNALAQEMQRGGLITESVGEGVSPQEEAYIIIDSLIIIQTMRG